MEYKVRLSCVSEGIKTYLSFPIIFHSYFDELYIEELAGLLIEVEL